MVAGDSPSLAVKIEGAMWQGMQAVRQLIEQKKQEPLCMLQGTKIFQQSERAWKRTSSLR